MQVQLATKVSPEIYQALDDYAKTSGRSKSSIIEEALRKYLPGTGNHLSILTPEELTAAQGLPPKAATTNQGPPAGSKAGDGRNRKN